MEPEEREVLVYSGTLVEAQRAWSMLTGHGIAARVVGAGLGGTYGTCDVPVLVRASAAESAQDVLAASGLVQSPER